MLAYRMDNTSLDMRTSVGLGSCNSCDYFTFANERVVLIEETRLIEQIKDLQEEYGQGLDDKGRPAPEIRRALRKENRLKVYGSLLVLCWLAKRLENKIEAKMVSGIVDFFLVVSDEIDSDSARYFDHIKDDLKGDLRGVLRTAVNDVRVVWARHIGSRLPARPAPK